jgi:hypothetical protein
MMWEPGVALTAARQRGSLRVLGMGMAHNVARDWRKVVRVGNGRGLGWGSAEVASWIKARCMARR